VTSIPLIKSPCVSICVLDERGLCRGCYRSGEEIRTWLLKPDSERKEVLAMAKQRSKKNNPFAAQ
jgi:hypothetical protein